MMSSFQVVTSPRGRRTLAAGGPAQAVEDAAEPCRDRGGGLVTSGEFKKPTATENFLLT